MPRTKEYRKPHATNCIGFRHFGHCFFGGTIHYWLASGPANQLVIQPATQVVFGRALRFPEAPHRRREGKASRSSRFFSCRRARSFCRSSSAWIRTKRRRSWKSGMFLSDTLFRLFRTCITNRPLNCCRQATLLTLLVVRSIGSSAERRCLLAFESVPWTRGRKIMCHRPHKTRNCTFFIRYPLIFHL